jgi:hypothetical protein
MVSEAARNARIRDVFSLKPPAQKQQIGDDAFREFMQHHAGGG